MDDKVYYASNYDNHIHNINDVKHGEINLQNGFVDILDDEGCVIDEVVAHTLSEILEVYK